MSITCQICNRIFEKQLTNSHLKTHQITPEDYIKQYGSVSSDEYKNQRSLQCSGENNPNYNNKWTDGQKEKQSIANKGKIPHNKGVPATEEQKEKQSVVMKEYYANNVHPCSGVEKSEETRKKISETLTGRIMPDDQLQKNIEVNRINAKKKQIKYNYRVKETYEGYGYEFLSNPDDNELKIYLLKHTQCGNIIKRSKGSCTDGKDGSGLKSNICHHCFPISTSMSSYEPELLGRIREFYKGNIIISDKETLAPFEIDLLFPELNVGIEINGLYWHSEEMGKGQWFHYQKTKKAAEKGIRLIHIFEDEWLEKQEIVINRLRVILNSETTKYDARKCTIKEIEYQECKDFLINNHIQGYDTAPVRIGLYYKELLISVMTFAKYNITKGKKAKENEWELSRFCAIGIVRGASQRLFKYFMEHYKPIKILSYSDSRWNSGNLYGNLGFKQTGETTPNYWYVDGIKRIHRWKLRKTTNDPKDKTEKELRAEQGYKRIWDCGSKRWELGESIVPLTNEPI